MVIMTQELRVTAPAPPLRELKNTAASLLRELTSLCPARIFSQDVAQLSSEVSLIDLKEEGQFNHPGCILYHLSRCTLILVLLRCLQTFNQDALRLMVNLRLTLCLL